MSYGYFIRGNPTKIQFSNPDSAISVREGWLSMILEV